MAIPKYDPHQTHQAEVVTEFFEHPDEGWMEFQPSTMRILGRGPGRGPVKNPIKLPPQFQGTPQPGVPTCSEPIPGRNLGCPKWAGCPFKALPFVGPGQVIMKHHSTVSNAHCYDYYETIDVQGKPISQRHYGMNGWKIDTSRTTIDVLGTTPVTNPLGQTISRFTRLWQKEIPDLLPPWWPMMKKKGLPLPPSAEMYPELTESEDECKDGSPLESPQPVLRKRRGRPTKKAQEQRATGSPSAGSAGES